jgi:hypothetical protein
VRFIGFTGTTTASARRIDLVAVHLVGAVGQAQRARAGVGGGEREVVADARAAMHLHGPVDHLAGHAGRGHLDHGDLLLGHLVAHGVHHVGSVEHQQARLVDQDARVGDALARHALVGQRLAEGHAAARAFAHQFERALGHADQAHAVVDAARAQAALGDLEAAALAQQHVAHRHAHVVKLTSPWPCGASS